MNRPWIAVVLLLCLLGALWGFWPNGSGEAEATSKNRLHQNEQQDGPARSQVDRTRSKRPSEPFDPIKVAKRLESLHEAAIINYLQGQEFTGLEEQEATDLISKLSAEEVLKLLAELRSREHEPQAYQHWIYQRWATLEPKKARLYVLLLPDKKNLPAGVKPARANHLSSVYQGWATIDPAGAWEQWKEDHTNRIPITLDEVAAKAIFKGYAERSPQRAWQELLTPVDPSHQELSLDSDMVIAQLEGFFGGVLSGQDWATYARELDAHTKSTHPTHGHAALAGRWMESDPKAALAWYHGQTKSPTSQLMAHLSVIAALKWMEHQPAQSTEWVRQQTSAGDLEFAQIFLSHVPAINGDQGFTATQEVLSAAADPEFQRKLLLHLVAPSYSSSRLKVDKLNFLMERLKLPPELRKELTTKYHRPETHWWK